MIDATPRVLLLIHATMPLRLLLMLIDAAKDISRFMPLLCCRRGYDIFIEFTVARCHAAIDANTIIRYFR